MTEMWNDDWKTLIFEAVENEGCTSLLDYARKHETKTFQQIATELGDGRFAPVMIEKVLRQDAEEASCMDYFMRSSLLRQLHHHVPNGLLSHGEWKLVRALSSWVGLIGTDRELERTSKLVADRIQSDETLPDDWLPVSSDDSTFASFFTS